MSIGGRTGRGGARRKRISNADPAAQRRENEAAPRIPDLFRRIRLLFTPHKTALITTITLVIVGAAISVAPPLLTQQAFDRGLFPPEGRPDMPVLVELVLIMIALWVTSALLGIWQTWLTANVGNKVMGALRVRLFSHLQSMELGFFTRTKTGVIQSRLQNDVGGVAGVLSNTVSSVIGNTVTVLAAFVSMLVLSWQMTLVTVIVMPLIVVMQRRIGRIRARIAAATQESLSNLTAITQESLSVSGILLAKSFTQQRGEVERYRDENHSQVELQVRQTMSGQWFFTTVQIFLSIIPAIIYVVAAWLIMGDVPVTAGTVVAFTTVQARLMWPLMGLMRVALDLQTSSALFARIFEYLDLQPSIADAAGATPVPAGQLGRIDFDDVEFRYPDAPADSAPTLDDLSFTIEPGQFAAFVGPSGAGKTTVSYLIPRLHDVSGGAVRFAGVDVRELQQEDLMRHTGIVSQETYLFHASIADNLRYAKPDATAEELEAAARKANIHETIVSFPDGYDTTVGERGYRLSGGEKQRVAIARVLLKDPAVLILDEATSALDSISERVVQQALETASRGRTTIAIAHRLSTIVDADVIFVISGGRVVERGTHDELLALSGVYSGLYLRQVAAE